MVSLRPDQQIAIIGGGIGGLAAAVALQRFGFAAHVYEAATDLAPVGKGIWVPTNAMQVLDRLGLGDAVEARGVPLERAEVRDCETGVIQSIDMSSIRETYGRTTVSIRRADLQAILAHGLIHGTLHLGRRCVCVVQEDASPKAVFDDGVELACDLLIGADGIHSTIRHAVSGHVAPVYAGQTCYLGLSGMAMPAGLARRSWEVWGGAQRFGFSPVADDQIYWFAPVTAPPDNAEAPDVLALLRQRYASFPSPIPEILAHTPAGDAIRVDLYDLPALDSWHTDKIVLVGDAAHASTPNLGQGGAQAIEDAWQLSESLANFASLETALIAFEDARRSRARRVASVSRWMGRIAHLQHGWACSARNLVLRSLPQRLMLSQLDWLYRLPAL